MMLIEENNTRSDFLAGTTLVFPWGINGPGGQHCCMMLFDTDIVY